MEVVEMIKSDGQVVLTVQQHPLHRPPVVPSSPPGIGVAAKRKGNNSRENITGPQPVDVICLMRASFLICERKQLF
jgi:hypothetical protein